MAKRASSVGSKRSAFSRDAHRSQGRIPAGSAGAGQFIARAPPTGDLPVSDNPDRTAPAAGSALDPLMPQPLVGLGELQDSPAGERYAGAIDRSKGAASAAAGSTARAARRKGARTFSEPASIGASAPRATARTSKGGTRSPASRARGGTRARSRRRKGSGKLERATHGSTSRCAPSTRRVHSAPGTSGKAHRSIR